MLQVRQSFRSERSRAVDKMLLCLLLCWPNNMCHILLRLDLFVANPMQHYTSFTAHGVREQKIKILHIALGSFSKTGNCWK